MKGILMKTDMIQATVEGRKTQTRRVIKPQPDKAFGKYDIVGFSEVDGEYFPLIMYLNIETGQDEEYVVGDPKQVIKPRYQVGETVYIKEALRKNSSKYHEVSYLSDNSLLPVRWYWERDTLPAVFMPEWAARHFLLIEAVSGERLQEISEGDAQDEGVTYYDDNAVDVFMELWDSINPKHPWDSNDWVWRYQFRLVC